MWANRDVGRRQRRLHPVYGGVSSRSMNALEGRLVIVPADGLGDLLELTASAAGCLAATNPALADALNGASARVRTELLAEPS